MTAELEIVALDELRGGVRLCDGRFEIEHRLGRGGVATVYQAVETTTRSRIALKILSEDRSDAQERTRLHNELTIGRRLGEHRNLVRALDCGTVPELDDRVFFAMELVRGPTLADLVMTKPIAVDRACRLIRDVAVGLAHMHRRGVVHRDVKPANVLVASVGEPEEHARLLDFGYAFALEKASLSGGARLTRADERPGTKHYMAPEQILGVPPAIGFDVYALGVTFYELLIGQPPLHALGPVEVAQRKVDSALPEFSIAGRRSDLPRSVVELVDRCLRRRPSERVADMDAFVAGLDALVAKAEVAKEGRPTALRRDVPKQTSTPRMLWVAGLGLLAVAGGLVVAAGLFGPDPHPDATGVGAAVATEAPPPTPPSLATMDVEPAATHPHAPAPRAVGPPAAPPTKSPPPAVQPEPEPSSPGTAAAHPGASPGPRPPKAPRGDTKRGGHATAPDPLPRDDATAIDCEDVLGRAKTARAASNWRVLVTLTKRAHATCWPTRVAWRRDRVIALYKTKAYDECVKLAERAGASDLATYAGLCRSKRDRQ